MSTDKDDPRMKPAQWSGGCQPCFLSASGYCKEHPEPCPVCKADACAGAPRFKGVCQRMREQFAGVQIEGQHGPLICIIVTKDEWTSFKVWEAAKRTREARLGDDGPPPGNIGEGASVSPSLPRRESPRPLLPKTMSARLELLLDLYAPIGHDGQRHPGDGVLTSEQFAKLFDAPESVSEGSK